MPRFKIKRKKKVTFEEPAKVEAPEAKVDEMETVIEEGGAESDGSDSLASVANSVAQMDIDPKPQPVVNKPQYRPNPPQQNQPSARFVHPPPETNNYRPAQRASPYAANQLYRKPSMPNPRRRSQRSAKTHRLKYRSHYGPGGEHLDAQTKARLLYHHCFG